MIEYSTALEKIISAGSRITLGEERVALPASIGRVTCHDIFAADNNPRFDHSAMDGYALRATWSEGASLENPLRIPVCGMVQAGDIVQSVSEAAVEIMTGAPIPEGLNAVIRIEDITVVEDGIEIRRAVSPGENIRRTGEDFKKDELLIPKGTRIGHQHVLALAVAGVAECSVRRRVRVALLSTGNELVPYDAEEIPQYSVRNSTAPYLNSVLTELGCDIVHFALALDTRDELDAALQGAVSCEPDLILTQGGVSAGRFDLVPDTVRALGGNIYFHKVAIRPAKPVLFGELHNILLIGMPGNPISTVVTARFFIKPLVQTMLGERVEQPSLRHIAHEISGPGSLTFFQRAVEDQGVVRVLKGQGSGMVKSFLDASGWIATDSTPGAIKEGTQVVWYSLF